MAFSADPILPHLTVCIPTRDADIGDVVRALSQLPEAAHCALLVHHHGPADAALIRRHEYAVQAYPGPKLLHVTPEPTSDAAARAWLAAHAPTDWLLLLDPGCRPVRPDYLIRYIAARARETGPALIAGGYSLDAVAPAPGERLHFGEARQDAHLPARTRAQNPGRYVTAANILVHKTIPHVIAPDDRPRRCGWTEMEWGLRVAEAFPVRHIDNPTAYHGLKPDHALLDELSGSGPAFARLVRRHPEAARQIPLLAAARRVKGVPLAASAARSIAAARFLPVSIRSAALKLYKAAACAPFVEP